MRKLLFVLSICLLFLFGCKETSFIGEIESRKSGETPEALDKTIAPSGGFEAEYGEKDIRGEGKIEEKIIRTAYVTVRSSKVKESYDKTLLLAKKYDGLIVNSSTSKWEESEEAVIEIKVPPKYFLILLDEIKNIGEIESKNISEEDVTEEYYDIEARLENKRKVRERLFDLLRKAYKVKEILEVEREIERVGEEIERLEGRLRYLNIKTDYARITVTIYNRRIPIIEKIGIKEGFIRSFQFSVKFFFGIIWFIIILIPLFILIIVLWLIIAWLIRRRRHRKRTS